MPILTKCIYDPAEPADGHRLLTMRLWPRGVRKKRVDAWERGLAPTLELLADYRSNVIDWPEYERRYLYELATRSDSIAALGALRQRAAHEPVTLMCGCKDETRCHRTLLKTLLEGTP
jgi:uncharacterized protein YeaO (DUF488 family)